MTTCHSEAEFSFSKDGERDWKKVGRVRACIPQGLQVHVNEGGITAVIGYESVFNGFQKALKERIKAEKE